MPRKSLLLTTLLLLFVGCAVSPSIDISKTAAVPPGECIVFGRVKLISEGRGLDLRFRWFPPPEEVSVVIAILHEDRSTASLVRVRDDGFFYWHLPNGDYTITEFRWNHVRPPRQSRRPAGARFAIPTESRNVYIGTLTIRLEAGRFTVRVEDEYEEALLALKQRFPEV